MSNVNTLNNDIDSSVIDYVIYNQTNDYQKKNCHNRYYLAFNKLIKPLLINHMLLKNKHPFIVLDAPCGSGIGTAYLSEQMEKYEIDFKIIGIDLCKNAIDYAKENYSNHKSIEFINDNILNILTDIRFDAFIYMEFLEHVNMNDAIEVIKKSQLLLNDGSSAIFSSPRLRPRESTIKRPGHINEFSEQLFYYTLEEYYPMVERYSFDRYANIVNYNSDANLMVGICHKWNSSEVFI